MILCMDDQRPRRVIEIGTRHRMKDCLQSMLTVLNTYGDTYKNTEQVLYMTARNKREGKKDKIESEQKKMGDTGTDWSRCRLGRGPGSFLGWRVLIQSEREFHT